MRSGKSCCGAAATAFAPATVANVGVGFDVLGFALHGVGDRVTVSRDAASDSVSVGAVTGIVPQLPLDPRRNTASVALLALLEARRPDHGFLVSIEKGIPLRSGMGGSAASAVGAVVAASSLLDQPLSPEELLRFALAGEGAASGSPHADNVAPCLYGGLTAVVSADPPEIISLPVPHELLYVLVRPHREIETRQARAALAAELPLSVHVEQTMHLCGFIAGCFRGDLGLIARSMVDRVAEPARAPLIPGFERAKQLALDGGALGFSIAGSGPSVFAWVAAESAAKRVESDVKRCFAEHGIACDGWVGPIETRGARLV